MRRVGNARVGRVARTAMTAVVLIGLWSLSLGPVGAAEPEIVYPDSMAALGDSISAGTGTVLTGFEAPWNSFSTGTNSEVNSLYSRILAENPAISGNAKNFARNGARMDDFPAQAAQAVTADVEFVTLLLGGNDVCRNAVDDMTTTESYRSDFKAGMDRLSAGIPDARVLVMSVPDVTGLWELFRDNPWVVNVIWPVVPCQALLKNPQSMAQADVDRRAAVRARVIEYNTVLAEECANYTICRFDDNGLFNSPFVANDISNWDYFHPSLSGHAKLAAGLWPLVGERPIPTVIPGYNAINPEGDTGSTTLQVPISLSAPSLQTVTVDWETFDVPANTAIAASGSDYVANSGTVTFAPGETTQTVSIEILGDTEDEPPVLYGEWGLLRYTNASEAVLDPSKGLYGLGVFIIVDDD